METSAKRSSALQFRRSHPEKSTEPEVDWEEVEATLKEVDPDGKFSDPRFDALKYSLRILGSVTAEKELNEVLFINVIMTSLQETDHSPPSHFN